MTVSFAERPALSTIPRRAPRRDLFPPKRDLSFPDLDQWTREPAIAAFNPLAMTTEGYLAVREQLAGRLRWVKKSPYALVGGWLVSNALRMLNEDAATPPRQLTLEEIQNWAPREEQLAWQLYELSVEQVPSDYFYSHDMEHDTMAAAVFALDAWKSDFMSKLSAAGRKGGQLSKRSKVFTVADLERVAGKSKAIQAAELGCSVATVSRLRREAYLTQAATK